MSSLLEALQNSALYPHDPNIHVDLLWTYRPLYWEQGELTKIEFPSENADYSAFMYYMCHHAYTCPKITHCRSCVSKNSATCLDQCYAKPKSHRKERGLIHYAVLTHSKHLKNIALCAPLLLLVIIERRCLRAGEFDDLTSSCRTNIYTI